MIEIPLGLRHALEGGNCVLFIGAGMGAHLNDTAGKQAPDGETLSRELCETFGITPPERLELATISQIVEIRKGRKELESFLRHRLSNLDPDAVMQALLSFRWRAIYTTNYDRGIERAYELIAHPSQRPVSISITADIAPYDERFDVPIYHLHGSLFGAASPQIIITEDDYTRFRESRRMLFELLKVHLATSTILYLGYSNRDPNWKVVLSEIKDEFYPSQPPISYRIVPDRDDLQIELLKARGVETLSCTIQEFVETSSIVISSAKIDETKMQRIKESVPTDLLTAFSDNPVAVARLLSSWIYVNQAPFNETANIAAFLRGDRPNWALIGTKAHFERDIEEVVYEELLDYATSTAKRPIAKIVLGPAGYGTSTLLMSLATKLVQERAGPVFMLRPGGFVLEGDIDFAISLFPERTFFFVDSAADQSMALNAVNHSLKERALPALFVLGERLNEWHQSRGKLRAKEFLMESLSDSEIQRLLDCLAKHGELNRLENLPRDLQAQAIKISHGKELLVAMREATEGRGFDAILEDEFRGISDQLSRQLYLVVCCLYQHGAYLRDSVLATLLNTSLPDLYERTATATEGVVTYDCIDESKGIYGARARHRTIATIVWERCGAPDEKERILQSALSAFNLNYATDRQAFEHLYRVDRMVDEIRSLDGKIKFFETACRKDPQSPYVRQHYARMLAREKKHELALGQIKEALHLDPNVRILHHTKGMILMELALSIEGTELARRRLVQSEESFRQAVRMHRRDEYSYQGLAQLYLGWAKRAPSPEEATEYLSKAEEAISEGLKEARARDALWIESSNIQAWLGNRLSHITALERAVKETPGSIVARYLLGRAYRKAKRYQEALDVLDYVIRNHPDEYRSVVEYALSLIYLGRSYADASAILNLSTLYGLSDPRFIATLGGMLFLDRSFSEAQRIFDESSKHDFTAYELNSIQFRPPASDNPELALRLPGTVVVVKAGYSLIDSPPFPRFLCPASKYSGLVMTSGLSVAFEIGFAARGPVADKPAAA